MSEAGEGVLVAHGDQGGGYLLWVEDGTLRFAHNDGRGRTRVVEGGAFGTGTATARFTAPGGGTWTVALEVDGVETGRGEGFALLYPMAPFEGIDVGIDRRSPVSWDLRQRRGTFAFSGALVAVTYTPGDLAPDAPQGMLSLLREIGLRFE